MYSLSLIYIVIPLIFSHFFARLWADFIITNGIGNFESVKVQIFLFLIIFVIGEGALTLSREKWNSFKGVWWKVLLSLVAFLGISLTIYPHINIGELLLGIWEKQHGILFVVGLIILSSTLRILDQKQLKKLTYIIIGTGVSISCIAILETFFNYNIFTWLWFSIKWSWGDARAIATLGNPNYVAGYLLMIIPLIYWSIFRYEKYILISILFFGLLATKSVIAITIISLYFLYNLTRKFLWKRSLSIFLLLIVIISLGIYFSYHESDKWLSLTSRIILMKHVFLGYIQNWPISLIFGNGPDSIPRLFSGERIAEITAYFPGNMIIDSSHNIFIDILYSYWLVWLGVFIAYTVKSWKSMSYTNKSVLLLGLLFFSLNVIVIVPMILIVFALHSQGGNSKNLS